MKAEPIGSHGEYPRLIFAVPQEVSEEAREGLWYRDEYGFGGTEVGVSRAIQLSTGRPPVTLRDIVVINAYFARHYGDKVNQYNPPSPGMIAWKLWGGWAGYGWVKDVMQAYQSDIEHGELHYVYEFGKDDRQAPRARANPHRAMMSNCVVDRIPRSNPDRDSQTPLILKRCVMHVLDQDGITDPSQEDLSRAFAICTARLQEAGRLDYGTRNLTPYGWEKERKYSAADRIASTVAYETMLDRARAKRPKSKSRGRR